MFLTKRTTTLTVLMLLAIILVAGLTNGSQVWAVGNRPDSAGGPRTIDDTFARLAGYVPSFGGMFLDGDQLKVYLLDPAHKASAERAIAAIFGRERIPAGGIQFLRAQYGFAQLKAWHESMGPLFDVQGVVFTDIDEAANRLKVGVETRSAFSAVHQELNRLGIPAKAVNVVVTEPIVSVVTLRDFVRPIEGGIQIHFGNFLCSLSFIGVRAGTAGFAVASHCTNTQGGVEGTQYFQPLSPNFIGTEVADPVYTKAKCPAGLKGKICRFSDSAFAQKDAAVSSDQGFIARPDSVNTGSLTIAGQFRITSEGASLVGQTVNKVGRTTGWSQGTVTNTCVDTGVQGSRIVQLCQDFVSATVAGGDSGSPVFAITAGNDVQLRGLLWGGNQAGTQFVYSPIANIQRTDELGPITTCATGFIC